MKTWCYLGSLGILFATVVMACATTVPPRELIERNDHGGLATWYEQESLRLRAKAEEMRLMADEYDKPSYQVSPKESRAELITHCQLFIESYTKAAEQAEAMARLHREQDKAIP